MICKSCKNEIPDNAIFCQWCGEKQLKERKKKKKDEIKIPEPRQLPSGKWRMELRAEGVGKTFDTADEARTWAKAVRAEFLTAEKKVSKTLANAIDEYIDVKRGKVSPSTVPSYLKIKNTRFLDLQKQDISKITLSMMQNAIDEEVDKISAKTMKDAVCFVRTVLRYNNINPEWWPKLAIPKVKPKVYTLITPEQIPILVKAAEGDPCEIEILLALFLGLRRSEIIALEKSDFNFECGEVTVKSALVRDEHGTYVDSGTKEIASVRVVPCPKYILEKVSQYPDGKLYTHDANYILKRLHAICEKADLPQIRLHDLRHVSASINDLLNMPDNYSMQMHGWSNTHTMKTVYEQTFDSEKEKWAKVREDYLEELISPKNC